MKGLSRPFIVVLTALMLIGCLDPPTHEVVLDGDPVTQLTISEYRSGDEIVVDLRDGFNYMEAFEIDHFQGLIPGVTKTEADSILGPPISHVENLDGTEIAIYHGAKAQLEVSHRKHTSWGGGWWWELRAFPDEVHLERYLPSQVLEYTDSDRRSTIVMINPDGTAGIEIHTEKGQVQYLMWVNKNGQRKPIES